MCNLKNAFKPQRYALISDLAVCIQVIHTRILPGKRQPDVDSLSSEMSKFQVIVLMAVCVPQYSKHKLAGLGVLL